jgi:hypothetical protein
LNAAVATTSGASVSIARCRATRAPSTSPSAASTELVVTGRIEEAPPVSRESVEAHRMLADGRDDYLLDFAIAFQGCSAILQWTGRLQEAVPSLREELDIRRRFAAGNDPGGRDELSRCSAFSPRP